MSGTPEKVDGAKSRSFMGPDFLNTLLPAQGGVTFQMAQIMPPGALMTWPAGQPATKGTGETPPARGNGSVNVGSSSGSQSELVGELAGRLHGVKRSEIDKVIRRLKLSREEIADLHTRLSSASASAIWNELKAKAPEKKEEAAKKEPAAPAQAAPTTAST